MRAGRIAIITIALIMSGITVQAQQGRGPVPATGQYYQDEAGPDMRGPASEAKREEVRKKIEAVRMWRLTEELKLDEKTSTRLASFLSSIEEKRRELMEANMALMKDVRTALKRSQPNEGSLKTLLDKIEKNQRDLIDLREKEHNGIKEILTVEQQARYLVFQQQFRHEMRRMIAGARANASGPGQRGPERSPGR